MEYALYLVTAKDPLQTLAIPRVNLGKLEFAQFSHARLICAGRPVDYVHDESSSPCD